MLLIIFLGLISTLMSVSGDCIVGKQGVELVHFTETLGTWYVLYHTNNTFDNNFECVKATYGSPEGNVGSVALNAYDKSEQSYVTLNGIVSNWTNNTLDENFQQNVIWSGTYYVIAIDYNRYVILKVCSSVSNQLYVYVAFRSNRPDKKTRKLVSKELRRNDIDFEKLVEWKANNCQQPGPSK